MKKDLSMEKVNRIKERHEGRLMGLPQVVGVAVGWSEGSGADAGNRIVIKVFVSSRRPPAELPKELEGVPVEVVESGEFRPL